MYKDRGIIKWAPFDSLVSFKTDVKQMVETRNATQKPLLSEDQKVRLDETLQQIKLNSDEVYLVFYENKKISHLTSKIIKIDVINKKLILEYKMSLLINDILSIEII